MEPRKSVVPPPEAKHGIAPAEEDALPVPVTHAPRECQTALHMLLARFVTILSIRNVDQVVVRAQRCGRFVVLERDAQRRLHERARLVVPSQSQQKQVLGVQRLRQHFREVEGLGKVQRCLDALCPDLSVSLEEMESSQLCRQPRERLVGRIMHKDLECAVHVLE